MGPRPNAGRPTGWLSGRPPGLFPRPERGSRACTPLLGAGACTFRVTRADRARVHRSATHRCLQRATRHRLATRATIPRDDDPARRATNASPTPTPLQWPSHPHQGTDPPGPARSHRVPPTHLAQPRPAGHDQAGPRPRGHRDGGRRPVCRRRRVAVRGRGPRQHVRGFRQGRHHPADSDPVDHPDLGCALAGRARGAVHQFGQGGPGDHGPVRGRRPARVRGPDLPRPSRTRHRPSSRRSRSARRRS